MIPETRDLLVEVKEGSTATSSIGAGVNSNGGVGGNITYEQKNFDITNLPSQFQRHLQRQSASPARARRSGISFEPGTSRPTRHPLLSSRTIFDQPYGFTGEVYLRNRIRERLRRPALRRTRLARTSGSTTSGPRRLTLRGEDVDIHNIQDKEVRAEEILDAEGHSTLTSVGLSGPRDTTNRGLRALSRHDHDAGLGIVRHCWAAITPSSASPLGFDCYNTLNEDLLDRKTVLGLHRDAGYISGNRSVLRALLWRRHRIGPRLRVSRHQPALRAG